jgi:dTMP kinase
MSGKLFVIEGLDGSGKQTQSDLLYARLKNDGMNILKVSYPNYASESSSLVKMYLRGDFGKDPQKISPYISSTFFAADRYASYKTEYETFYHDGGIVIADRYTTSNMLHQASKIDEMKEKTLFLEWLWNLEFVIYGIPIPTQVFFLDVEPALSMKMIRDRENKFSHTQLKDIHENDSTHLERAYQNAGYLIERYGWEKISCENSLGEMLSIDAIHHLIYRAIQKYL